jgi:hypothetical protein
MRVAFDNWDAPDIEYNGMIAAKNFDQFRDEVTIRAGYFDLAINGANKVIRLPRSWSFARMDETEFEKLFDQLVTVILAHYLNSFSRNDIDKMVATILGFA